MICCPELGRKTSFIEAKISLTPKWYNSCFSSCPEVTDIKLNEFFSFKSCLEMILFVMICVTTHTHLLSDLYRVIKLAMKWPAASCSEFRGLTLTWKNKWCVFRPTLLPSFLPVQVRKGGSKDPGCSSDSPGEAKCWQFYIGEGKFSTLLPVYAVQLILYLFCYWVNNHT